MKIQLTDFYFAYSKNNNILNDINLLIDNNDCIGLIGPNGAGKSTLLKCLVGLNKKSSGHFFVNEIELDYKRKSLINLNKNIQLLFQNPDDQIILDDVRSEIGFGLLNLGYSQDYVLNKINIIANKLNITKLLDQPIHTLSFGQKKKICLASILVLDPEILILDEPTAGLDQASINDMLVTINDIKANSNISIIMSSHDYEFILNNCSRIVMLENGQIKSDTTKNIFVQNNLDLLNSSLNSNYLKLLSILNKEYKDFNYYQLNDVINWIKNTKWYKKPFNMNGFLLLFYAHYAKFRQLSK
ncbi:energy-coupling factor ABC transporter ATP-binding protein [Mycoplasma sp. P36-A1]|uniref:energy-coupling factor ABC transporter ATP-binding protein n=1 Tax=Mycoplasma sp. P36-A1 TaxID=3252900 RepID=UPI003C2CA4DD